MKFKKGQRVRISNDVTTDMLESEAVPQYMLRNALTVVVCGRPREGGERYRVALPYRGGWWLPGHFLERVVTNCMFDKEV